MWEVLLEHISKEEALKQLNDLESKGVFYTIFREGTMEVVETKQEPSFNLTPLINAYQVCLEHYKSKTWNDLQCIHWKREVLSELVEQLPEHITKEWKRAVRTFDFRWSKSDVAGLEKDLASLTRLQQTTVTNITALIADLEYMNKEDASGMHFRPTSST